MTSAVGENTYNSALVPAPETLGVDDMAAGDREVSADRGADGCSAPAIFDMSSCN